MEIVDAALYAKLDNEEIHKMTLTKHQLNLLVDFARLLQGGQLIVHKGISKEIEFSYPKVINQDEVSDE